MERQLKTISKSESICRDIVAADPENQMALRYLGLAITDQFTGAMTDRFKEAEENFGKLTSPYERSYYMGILYERRAKAQLRSGQLAHTLRASFEAAMRHFEEAEQIRPKSNDDTLLRWNRCLRLLDSIPDRAGDRDQAFEIHDTPPL